MENRELVRKKSFKKGIDAEDGRRRRTETTLQIRKSKKDEQLAKRRAAATASENKPAAATTNAMDTIGNNVVVPPADTGKKVRPVSDLPLLVANIRFPSKPNDQFDATQAIRRMLAVERDVPVEQIISSGVLPDLVNFLRNGDLPNLQFEAAWALTNVASTQHTAEVCSAGAIPALVLCLRSADPNVREQAGWCLGNIAGDSTQLRDAVLAQQAMEPLLLNVEQPASDSLLHNVIWTISNLMRGKPQPGLHSVGVALPFLARLLHSSPNKNVLIDVCWSLSYASDGPDDRIQAVIQQEGIVPALVGLLESDDSNIVIPVVRCMGNFASGSDSQTQAILDADFMKSVKRLLTNPRKSIQKETCWVLSNIAAGTPEQVNALFSRYACLSFVVEKALEASWEVRKEAIWVVANIFSGGTDEQVDVLAGIDGINVICEALKIQDTTIIMTALEALEKILKVGERNDKNYVNLIDECDGIDTVEKLQEHQNDVIYRKVVHIIETYLGTDDHEDENLAPSANENTFEFGLQSKQLFKDFVSPMSAPGEQQNNEQQPFQQQFNFGNDFGRSAMD